MLCNIYTVYIQDSFTKNFLVVTYSYSIPGLMLIVYTGLGEANDNCSDYTNNQLSFFVYLSRLRLYYAEFQK